MTDEEIVKSFFTGTTCNRYKHKHKMLIRGEKYSIIKHGSHAEYVNRFDKIKTCESIIYIVKNGDSMYGHKNGNEYKELFTGRVNKEKMKKAKEILEESEKNNKIVLVLSSNGLG